MMIPVNSSLIRAVGYDGYHLFVQFHTSDTIYTHHGVPDSVFAGFHERQVQWALFITAISAADNIEIMQNTTSVKQIAANQANAQKSTGPKTPEGRAVSKMNALKHGIFSKEVLVRGLNIKESSRELEELYERFWQEYNPVGPVEEMLVDQIVTAHWRLRRALRAESGEIALERGRGPLETQPAQSRNCK